MKIDFKTGKFDQNTEGVKPSKRSKRLEGSTKKINPPHTQSAHPAATPYAQAKQSLSDY